MAANRVCHFKLVLLGDSAVGKSCLVVRFVRDEFFDFQEPTIGGMYSYYHYHMFELYISFLFLIFVNSRLSNTNCCFGRCNCKI